MQKITPCLWFDGNAEEAVNFYASVFPDARVLGVQRYGPGAPLPEGTVLTMTFSLFGQEFMALNGGPEFKFDEAVSFIVDCESQEEVDYYWERLTAGGGEESMCGWLKDRFGLSWQIVPRRLVELVSGPDRARAARVMQAMLQMRAGLKPRECIGVSQRLSHIGRPLLQVDVPALVKVIGHIAVQCNCICVDTVEFIVDAALLLRVHKGPCLIAKRLDEVSQVSEERIVLGIDCQLLRWL